MRRTSVASAQAQVGALCRALGLGETRPSLLRGGGHRLTLLLAPQRIVARFTTLDAADEVPAASRREVAVARHLAARGAPATVPLSHAAGPHRVAGGVVTLWPWIDHDRVAGEGDAAIAARTLAALHEGLRGYAGALPSYDVALDHCASMLAAPASSPALAAADRSLLRVHLARRRDAVAGAPGCRPLHGDAHPGNLLLGAAGAVWTDFEDSCLGPPEYDIGCLPPAAWPLFTAADQRLVATFADLRSLCVATWCSARSDSAGARDALAHHLAHVRALPR